MPVHAKNAHAYSITFIPTTYPTARPLLYTTLYTPCAYTVIHALAIGPLVNCYGFLYGIKRVFISDQISHMRFLVS